VRRELEGRLVVALKTEREGPKRALSAALQQLQQELQESEKVACEVHADVVAATAKQKELLQQLQQELHEAEKVVREAHANVVVAAASQPLGSALGSSLVRSLGSALGSALVRRLS
jgi:hypothetical protein